MKNNLIFILIITFLFLGGCGEKTSTTSSNENATTNNTTNQNITTASLRFSNTNTTFSVGEAVEITVANIKLTEKTYQAFFDEYGDSLAATTPNNNLVILLPKLTAGKHTVTIRINNQSYDLNFTVAESKPIANPKVYINSLVSDVKTELESLKKTNNNADIQAELSSLQQQLTQQATSIASLSESDAAYLAQVLSVNLAESTASKPDLVSCNALFAVVVRDHLVINQLIRSFVFGTASTLINPIFGAIVTGYNLAKFITRVNAVLETQSQLIAQCLDTTDFFVEEDNTAAKNSISSASKMAAKSLNLNFDDGVTKNFYIYENKSLSDTIALKLNAIYTLIKSITAYLPSNWTKSLVPPSLTKTALTSSLSNYSLNAISNALIEGQVINSGSQLGLNFAFKTSSTSNKPITFTFTLVNKDYPNLKKIYTATLNPINLTGFWEGTFHYTSCITPGYIGAGDPCAYALIELADRSGGGYYGANAIYARLGSTEANNIRIQHRFNQDICSSVSGVDLLIANSWSKTYSLKGVFFNNDKNITLIFTVEQRTPSKISGIFSGNFIYPAYPDNTTEGKGYVTGEWELMPRADSFPKCLTNSKDFCATDGNAWTELWNNMETCDWKSPYEASRPNEWLVLP